MRHTTTLATVLLLATLTACGGQAHSDKPAVRPKATHTVSKEALFLDAVHRADFQSWKDTGPADSDLTGLPPQWCDGLAAGHSVKYLLSDAGGLYPWGPEWGTNKAEANELVVMGVKAYCPKRSDAVAEELRASGDY